MTTKITVDLCLDASWIAPVIPRGRLYTDCSLLINGDTIIGITPTSDVSSQYTPLKRVDLTRQLIMPGLINTHGHAAMALLRGFADDHPLDTWLQDHIWPAENRWVNETFVEDGSKLAIAEMLLTGTTCFADMYYFPEACAAAAREAGIRAQITFPILDAPNNWSRDADDAFHKGLQLRDKYRSHPLIEIGFGPHAPYTVSDQSLQRIATYAEELQAPIQIHLHETAHEIDTALAETGIRPLQRLHDLGLLTPLTQCVHMTQTTADDRALLKLTGAHVIHCPQSNMKLASGTCNAQQLLDADINVALGTDGAASNNTLNMFAELQTAALLGKLAANNPAAINATTAIEMATINGARAMGIEEKVGSLEAGKQADVIAIDLSNIASLPVHNPLSQLVYTGAGAHVTHVWVAGEQRVHNGALTQLSLEEIKINTHKWQNRMKGNEPPKNASTHIGERES
ncbi:TRZ/ATZ family hydrolase [Teredinibacter purpureus]|uniref:TRZ/ATZ family hydrolase n=1 Tax=Teredinibacter purpureus TaxID=2731756 RepID=UPI0005F79643|nr:TRZ/ATZ family hydrolase [Teredinibacter purpureus]